MKDLSRLGRELSKVIIVDNSPASYIFHPENAVSVLRIPNTQLWFYLPGFFPDISDTQNTLSEC